MSSSVEDGARQKKKHEGITVSPAITTRTNIMGMCCWKNDGGFESGEWKVEARHQAETLATRNLSRFALAPIISRRHSLGEHPYSAGPSRARLDRRHSHVLFFFSEGQALFIQ